MRSVVKGGRPTHQIPHQTPPTALDAAVPE